MLCSSIMTVIVLIKFDKGEQAVHLLPKKTSLNSLCIVRNCQFM